MTVASVDTRTGESILFSCRGTRAERPGRRLSSAALLNEVFQWGEDHGGSGADLLKSTIGDILGLDVDYYAMVDMQGFAQIINAMGGVTLTVKNDIVFGAYREGLIKAGTRHMNGTEALWFGRSRTDSDDYQRMGRQKCLLNAGGRTGRPAEGAARLRTHRGRDQALRVDRHPRSLLPDLIDLAPKVKGADIKSLQFVPPLIRTGNPDWDLIRSKVHDELTPRPVAATAKPKTRPRRRSTSTSLRLAGVDSAHQEAPAYGELLATERTSRSPASRRDPHVAGITERAVDILKSKTYRT